MLSFSPGHRGEALGPRRKLYSAVPGRHFVVVRSYTVQAEGEINLYKGDRVKGEKSLRINLVRFIFERRVLGVYYSNSFCLWCHMLQQQWIASTHTFTHTHTHGLWLNSVYACLEVRSMRLLTSLHFTKSVPVH